MSFTVENAPTIPTTPTIPNMDCPICFEKITEDDFMNCMQCNKLCCNKCIYKIISFCPGIKKLTWRCPMCRNGHTWTKYRDIKRDRKYANGLLKNLLAQGSDNKTEHIFRNINCCQESEFKITIRHEPCESGCLDCNESKLTLVSTTEHGIPVKSVGGAGNWGPI